MRPDLVLCAALLAAPALRARQEQTLHVHAAAKHQGALARTDAVSLSVL